MKVFDFVKLHSGLERDEEIEHLCSKLKVYMQKNKIDKMSPALIKEVQAMSLDSILDSKDKNREEEY